MVRVIGYIARDTGMILGMFSWITGVGFSDLFLNIDRIWQEGALGLSLSIVRIDSRAYIG